MERRGFIKGVLGLAGAAAAKVALGDDFKVAELKIQNPQNFNADLLDGANLDDLRKADAKIQEMYDEAYRLGREEGKSEAEVDAIVYEEYDHQLYEAYVRSRSTANPNSGRCIQCDGPLDDTRKSKVTRICAPCLMDLRDLSLTSHASQAGPILDELEKRKGT